MIKTLPVTLLLILILLLAGLVRFVDINWDQGQHLHPDERFLTMVANNMVLPASLSQYLDTNHSLVNPHNLSFDFYVYGTWPVILVKVISVLFKADNYARLILVGRAVSGVFDLGTVLLVFFITRRLFTNSRASLFAALVYALMTLPIQLSHFFAVDTFLLFPLTLSFLLLLHFLETYRPSRLFITAAYIGFTFGLAVAAKVSAALFSPVILLGFLIRLNKDRRHFFLLFLSGIIFIIFTYLAVRLFLPYLFADSRLLNLSLNSKLLANWHQLKSWDTPAALFPPGVQWLTAAPYIFPLLNLILFGLGLPLGLFCLYSLFIVPFKRPQLPVFLALFWVCLLFVYQGNQFSKPLRYLYPIYPFLAVFAGYLLSTFKLSSLINKITFFLLFVILFIWPVSFLAIYFRPHTRVSASSWIYSHIPADSRISCEHWDDCLPLSLSDNSPRQYTLTELPLYDPDTSAKWSRITAILSESDFVVLTSNRLYASLSSVPEKYPIASVYYPLLFSGRLGFKLVSQFTSRPTLPLPFSDLCLSLIRYPGYGLVSQPYSACSGPGLQFVDDYAEESFTVYDHPKVFIFKNVGGFTAGKLYTLIFNHDLP